MNNIEDRQLTDNERVEINKRKFEMELQKKIQAVIYSL